MKKFFLSLFILIQIAAVFNFDCSGIDESGCKDFTYSGSFINNTGERIEALKNFYDKLFNKTDKRNNFTFELDDKNVLIFYINYCNYLF